MADGKTDYSKYILPAGLILLAWAVYNAIFGASQGAQQNAANQAAVTTTDNAANAATLAATLAVQQPTLTASQIASMANTIFSLGQSGTPVSQPNQDSIQAQVLNCNNNADWFSLVSAFGVKQVSAASNLTAMLLPESPTLAAHGDDLQAYLDGVLDQNHINDINMFFSGAGINQSL